MRGPRCSPGTRHHHGPHIPPLHYHASRFAARAACPQGRRMHRTAMVPHIDVRNRRDPVNHRATTTVPALAGMYHPRMIGAPSAGHALFRRAATRLLRMPPSLHHVPGREIVHARGESQAPAWPAGTTPPPLGEPSTALSLSVGGSHRRIAPPPRMRASPTAESPAEPHHVERLPWHYPCHHPSPADKGAASTTSPEDGPVLSAASVPPASDSYVSRGTGFRGGMQAAPIPPLRTGADAIVETRPSSAPAPHATPQGHQRGSSARLL
jgi:hypothetical protein